MSFALETGRLRLRSWRSGDAPLFEAACNTPAVTRYLGGVMTSDAIVAMVDRLPAQEAEQGFCFWALERLSDAAFLGFCGLKRLNAPGASPQMQGQVEIGWRLREGAWGQGYAREAATATLDAAFGRFDLPRVYAMTMPGNVASWGLTRRLGMTERPDLAFEWDPHGPHIVYEMERSTWTA